MGKLRYQEGKGKVTRRRRDRTGPPTWPQVSSFNPPPRLLLPLAESAMERDRYMSPMEAQEFGILDKVLVHPPQDGEDEPELVQKEPVGAATTAEPTPASI